MLCIRGRKRPRMLTNPAAVPFICAAPDRQVAVTIAYRLNVLGFLVTSDLTAEGNGTSGNYGILDQLEALRWVRDSVPQ